MRDDCDPDTFNAVLGEGACVGDGDTTFADLFEQLEDNGFEANHSARAWRFAPGEFHIDEGDDLRIKNEGGEFHTWTEVTEFGPGCVEELNLALGLDHHPVDECAIPDIFLTTGVFPGESIPVDNLPEGKHKFECLIHPWMQSVVTVRGDGDDHSDHH